MVPTQMRAMWARGTFGCGRLKPLEGAMLPFFSIRLKAGLYVCCGVGCWCASWRVSIIWYQTVWSQNSISIRLLRDCSKPDWLGVAGLYDFTRSSGRPRIISKDAALTRSSPRLLIIVRGGLWLSPRSGATVQPPTVCGRGRDAGHARGWRLAEVELRGDHGVVRDGRVASGVGVVSDRRQRSRCNGRHGSHRSEQRARDEDVVDELAATLERCGARCPSGRSVARWNSRQASPCPGVEQRRC